MRGSDAPPRAAGGRVHRPAPRLARQNLALLAIALLASALLAPAAGGPAGAQVFAGYGGLTTAERTRATATLQQALETLRSGQSAQWDGDTPAVHGYARPLATFKSTGGHWCRIFEEAVVTEAGALVREATACRSQDDGRWLEVERAG